MAHFTINTFGGSTPRLAPHLVQQNHAVKAMDCRLESGQLSSWRELKFVEAAEADGLVDFGCCRAFQPDCIEVAHVPSCGRAFVTSASERPRWFRHLQGCSYDSFILGVPVPAHPPSVNIMANDPEPGFPDEKLELQVFAYQYENVAGERGELSPPSDHVDAGFFDNIILSTPHDPNISISEWGLTRVIFYRAEYGYETGFEQGNTDQSAWVEIGSADLTISTVANLSFVPENDFGPLNALEVDLAPPPPRNLRGITLISGTNTLCGYAGNSVYFSDNNRYYSWPHFLELEHKIKGIAENNGVLYVGTTGEPYIISAAVDCDSADCRSVTKLPGNYPMLSVGNRGMAKVRAGAVYPSRDGLILLAGTNAPVVLTWPLYTSREWMAMGPNMARPIEHGGKLFVFMSKGAFVMSSPEGSEQGWSLDFHSELSDRNVRNVLVTRNGLLFIHKGNELYQWDAGTTLREHTWQSRELVKPVNIPFGAGNMNFHGGEEAVTVRVDGRTVLNRNVLSSREFRLPMWATGTRWDVTLRGTATVNLLTLAETMQEVGS